MSVRRHHPRRRAGYSLVELMVALTAGAILISSAYVLAATSSRFFHRTSRVATTQSSLRMAANQLRADVARAGFLAHPDTNPPSSGGMKQSCGINMASGVTNFDGVADTLRGVQVSRVGTAGAANNEVRQDRLTLTGNYATDERYDLRSTTDPRVIEFDPTSAGFRRSFVSIAGTSYSTAAFTAAFAPGRILRVDVFTPRRETFFRRIASRNAGTLSSTPGSPVTFSDDPSVTLEDALPACADGQTQNGFAAPVVTLDYQIVDPSTLTALANVAGGVANGAAMEGALVRREWTYGSGTGDFRANSERVALEYAIEFGITALYCNVAGTPCAFADLIAQPDLAGLESSQIQGLRLTLAARTPEADPTFDPGNAFNRGSWQSGNPLLSWSGAGFNGRGRARVRTATFDVALLNNRP